MREKFEDLGVMEDGMQMLRVKEDPAEGQYAFDEYTGKYSFYPKRSRRKKRIATFIPPAVVVRKRLR